MRNLLGDIGTVSISFRGNSLGEKRVDWKHRRISVGRRQTAGIPSGDLFDLQVLADGSLEVSVTSP